MVYENNLYFLHYLEMMESNEKCITLPSKPILKNNEEKLSGSGYCFSKLVK